MPFTPSGTWDAYYSFRDNNGNIASVTASFSASLSYAQAVTAAGDLAVDLEAISDARLERFTVSTDLINDNVAAPAASSEVERKLALTLGTATFPAASSMQVPSPIFAIEQPRTDAVDPANAAYVALASQLTNGGLGGNNGVTTYRGEDLTRITRAVVTHRSRKPRA
jgi:hypothetical protein